MSAHRKPAQSSPVTADEFAAAVGPFRLSGKIAVAFSGGPDSLALLILAARWARSHKGISLHAFTVDHGLRAASAKEAKEAGALAKKLGVSHRILRWKGEKPGSGIQAAARKARYGLLLDACRKQGVCDLLVAHHLEDQAETFLLRLSRGSGVDGLAAMAPERILTDVGAPVRVLRPLLDIPRKRLAATVAKSGLSPILDPSNEDERYDRVKARKALELLEPLGLDALRLARTASHLARARQALEAQTEALLSTHAMLSPFGHAELACEPLLQAPSEIGLRVLAALIRIVGDGGHVPRLDALEAIHAAIGEGTLGSGRTLGGAKLALKGGTVLVTREVAAARAAPPLTLKAGGEGLWDGRFLVRLDKAPRGARVEVRVLGDAGLSALRAAKVVLPAARAAVLQPLPGLWRDGDLVASPHLGTIAVGLEASVALRRTLLSRPSKVPENAGKKGKGPGAGTW